MRRRILARLLVFCMIVSMMAVPATAMDDPDLTDPSWTAGPYKLTYDTTTLTFAYNISSGAYSIDLNGKTLAGSITVSGTASLSVSDREYSNGESAGMLNAVIKLSGTSSRFSYSVGSDTYVIRGSAFSVVPSDSANYEVVWESGDNYSIARLNYIGGSGGSSGSSASPATDSRTITTKSTTSGNTVTVQAPDLKAVDNAGESGSKSGPVIIDVSKSGSNVTTATVPTKTLDEVSGLAHADSLTIAMPAGDVTLSDAALAAIVAEAGTDVSVTLDVSNSTASLAAAQQESLTGLATGAAIDVSVTSNGKEITSFGGGSVTLSVPFKAPAANRPAEKFAVYYVAPTGGLTRQPTSYADGKLSFSTTHFSDYVAIFEPFADVTADKWYAQYALYVSDNSIMNGTDKGFEGDLNLNRAMMVTTLYRIKGASAGSAAAFSDVAAGQWFTDAVNWAASNGVASGVGNNLFAPNADMTREQMAQFLYNYAKANGKDVSKAGDLSRFADASSVSGWAKEAMAWAVGQGYINGMDGKLNPQGTATRAQVATVLTRFAQA